MRILLILLIVLNFSFGNELSKSTSPYLLQHANNPVNWMEWGDRAFKKAKDENRLIFLSIGYSTCHWCHVMAKESFSQKDVAKILNDNFVSIKVDRERLSYIDDYYQKEYQIVNQRAGGWPLNIILLPDKKPLFFGTYMPKNELIALLKKIVSTDRNKLGKIAEDLQKAIYTVRDSNKSKSKIADNLLQKALKGYEAVYDSKYKGFSKAPKFPQPNSINELLNIYLINGDKKALKMATDILDAMAKGGIYDQIDGGFFRYSVDEKWQIPHFEKMLYSNAELISVYSKAYKITKSKLYAKVVKESIREFDKRFIHNGLYFSASNADSKDKNGEEKEGYYYVFNYQEALDYLIKNGITKPQAQKALEFFGIEPMGNFDGGEYSNPHLKEYKQMFERERRLLSQLRRQREYPFIDKKINTAWNALFIKAKMDAGVVDKYFEKEAIASLCKLLAVMFKKGKLYHQTLMPNKPVQEGLLEDYAFVADALFKAYNLSLDSKYLNDFKQIVKQSVNLFYKNGKWYESADKEFKVEANLEEGSYKSALATELANLLKAALVGEEYKNVNIAVDTLDKEAAQINSFPQYYPSALNVITMKKHGIFIIKGPKLGLLREDFSDIKYPYVYKLEAAKNYQLCGLKSCYSSTMSIEGAKNKLKELLGEKIKKSQLKRLNEVNFTKVKLK